MKEKLLYEIPVYSVTEEIFDEKWDARRMKIKSSFLEHGHTEKYASQRFQDIYFPQYLWKYNQVVGCINISATNQEVIFRLFCTLDKNIRAISNTKHFIQDWDINGMSFYALHKDNEYLRENAKLFFKGVKEMLPERYYIDDTAFNNTIDNMDIRGAMESVL